MRPRSWLLAAALVALGLVCLRLGCWQLARRMEKRALNLEQRHALARPSLTLDSTAVPIARLRGTRVRLQGRYDESRQVRVAFSDRNGASGVEALTPLILERGDAVLVDRGWLPAPDAIHAAPEPDPEPGLREVVGLAEALPPHLERFGWRRLESRSPELWSTRVVALDSARAHLGRPLAPWVLHQLPGPGLSPRPAPSTPRPYDESMHASYAVQWFVFAALLFAAPILLRWSRRRPPVPPPPSPR